MRKSLLLLLTCACSTAHAGVPLTVKPTANLQYDWVRVDAGPQAQAEDGFRRARLGLRAQSEDRRWQVVIEHDFSDRTPDDAWLEWTPTDGRAVRMGQFKQPFSLEDAIADKQSAFMEASPVGALVIGRRIGLEYASWSQGGTLRVAVFGKRLDGSNASTGASLRGTWQLIDGDAGSAHIGFSMASEFPRDARASFGLNAGSVFSSVKTATTGSLTDVERIDRMAVEGVWIRGAWSMQVELAQVAVRRVGADVDGRAGNLQLTWSPTGDGRRDQRGIVTGPAASGHAGWELGLRWGSLDLDDGAVQGGRVQSWGLSATCYPRSHVRVIAQLSHYHARRAGIDSAPVTAGIRVQWTY